MTCRAATGLVLLGLVAACGGPEQAPSNAGGGAAGTPAAGASTGGRTPQAGAGGQAGTSVGGAVSSNGAGAGGTAGTLPSGGAGDVATGGTSSATGGSSNTEQIRQAAYQDCDEVCDMAHSACPAFSFQYCTGTCHDQADNFASTGPCGPEHLKALECYASTLSTADITCTQDGVSYSGCTAELAAYNKCVGGG